MRKTQLKSSRSFWLKFIVFITVLTLGTSLAVSGRVIPAEHLLTNLAAQNLPPMVPGHLLGTDNLGRDLLSMLICGASGTLIVAFCAALASALFGYAFGAASGLSGGLLDGLMMRFVDALLSVPSIILLLTISSLISAPEFIRALPDGVLSILGVTDYSLGRLPMLSVIVAIAATSWLESARVARGLVLSLKEEEYILAARALGCDNLALLKRHISRALSSVAALEATLLTADAIIMESGLSFIGLGLGPSTPSWGSLLRDAQPGLLYGNWWAAVLPGLCISATVLALHLTSRKYNMR